MDLTARVREDFGITLIGAHPTGLGADARAALFRGVTATGTSYAVKASTADQPGLAVANSLARQGIRGVPRPVATPDGALSSGRVPSPTGCVGPLRLGPSTRSWAS